MNAGVRRDLLILVADSNMEHSIRAMLQRPFALQIPEISYEIYVHPNRDPGCFGKGHDFIKPFAGQYRHAMILFDREGCGQERSSAEDLEQQVARTLLATTWQNRAAAVVIDPELEAWVWSDSPHVPVALGWRGRTPGLWEWLRDEQYLEMGTIKPNRPKEAMEKALYLVKKPRSSSVFAELARTVSLSHCTDRAFLRFRQLLRNWFPVP